MRYINSFLLAMVVLLITVSVACNKRVDIDSSSITKEEKAWKSFEDGRAGLMGIYGLFRAAIANNNAHWMWGELRDGDFRSVVKPDLKSIIDGNLNASYPLLQSVSDWRPFYAVINACNLFLERMDSLRNDIRYTESYYRLDKAQVRSMRAFAYFYMTRIWGDVPLITTSGEGGNFEKIAKTDKRKVLSFAEQELVESAPYLPFLYSGIDPEQKFPSNYYGYSQGDWANTPLTRTAAYALLAHIAAWQGRYVDVVTYTDFIQDNYTKSNLDYIGTVNVENSEMVSPTGFFLAGANKYKQLIGFSFNPTRGESSISGHIEQLTLAKTDKFYMSKQLPDIYVPKDIILEMFPISTFFVLPGRRESSNNDDRFGLDYRYTPQLKYTTYFENFDAEIPVFKKIRIVNEGVNDGSFAIFNSSIVFTRLEELMLLRAEALAQIDRPGPAFIILNDLRSRRGLLSLIPERVDLIDEIFEERRRELIGEGWRWYDLVRYNRIKRNNPEFNRLLDNDGIYWPIAQSVLDRNSLIQQNNYWK